MRSIAAIPAAIAAALVVLTAAFGGAPASAATSHASSKVTWHALSLLNGWRSDQATRNSGNPSWAVKGGVVYLSGSLHQPTGAKSVFAVLPPVARPAHTQFLTVYMVNGTTGTFVVETTGQMFVASAPSSDAQDYTSLAGVSFPAATTAMHKLSLRNGWQSGQSAYGTGDPGYTVTGGVVYLSGSMLQTAGTDLRFAVLPPAARPRHNLWIKTYTFGGAVGALLIRPSGVMSAFNVTGNAAQAYTSLAGVSYPLGS